MLETIGVSSLDDLFKDVPERAFIDGLANLPPHRGELEVERIMGAKAARNHAAPDGPFFLGAGCYYHHVPATVDYIIQRSEFLTAYTPYQPEIAQGTLRYVFEFQTFIAQLTGQELANASLYDGATACAEAALMAMRVTKRNRVVIGNALHPDYVEVLESYLGNYSNSQLVASPHPDPLPREREKENPSPSGEGGDRLVEARQREGGREGEGLVDESTACVIIQSPDFYGSPHAYEDWRKICDETGALLIVVVNEIVSLGLLPAPSGADIVCGEAQSVGLPMSFGGPHLGFFACREKFLRQMPGRLCGQTVDAYGRESYVLTLSTREQHIRREKATSNICTNQGLCALAFTVHMALLGEDGFKRLARLNHEAAIKTAEAVTQIPGVKLVNETFFNEFTVELPVPAAGVVERLAEKGIVGGYAVNENRLLLAATEMTTDEDIARLKDALSEILACG